MPNWNVLPEPLRFLGPYAEKYGVWTFPEEIDVALERLTPEERAELTELGPKFGPLRKQLRQFWNEILLDGLHRQTEAGRREPPPAVNADQEANLLTGLQSLLLQGGFVPRNSGPRLSPQQLRDLADAHERSEAEQERP